jgi:DNA-binding IclR family transcriptional regulator
MSRQYISDELKGFVKNQIQTVFRLEVLLLLHHEQSKAFTPADVALELGFERYVAREQLRSLVTLGLLVRSDTHEAKYHYGPANIAMKSLVDQLAETYSKRPVPILSLILAEPADRTRLFAEAFRLIKGTD